MNITLWILQVLLGVHTAIGAVWKLSNSEQSLPSLSVIPHSVWLGLSGLEMLCSLALIIPFYKFKKSLAILPSIAAGLIALEMFGFSALHLPTGAADNTPVIYWLVTAAVCLFVSWGRFKLRPHV